MTDHVRARPAAVARRRCAALFAVGALLPLPLLTACGADDEPESFAAAQDVAAADRGAVRDGGTVRWAVDAAPGTFNAFQADAGDATARVAGATLPQLFVLDRNGRPQRNADYLEAADVSTQASHQVVTYRLNPKARWNDGRPVSVADFVAQWHALRGQDNAYWTARNAGYDRIRRVEKGRDEHEVKVTFGKSYADWRALFTPLYPKSVMGSPDAFNDGARRGLRQTAGPFRLAGSDKAKGTVTLARDEKWWGRKAKLDRIELTAVPRGERAKAVAEGTVDVVELDSTAAGRVEAAGRPAGSASPAHKGDTTQAGGRIVGAPGPRARRGEPAAATRTMKGYTVHKALQPSYTQLALNGSTGPLTDERVRRAVARAIDRKALAADVLGPLGLPTDPLGSHLLMRGQPGYSDGSGALGRQDTKAATQLLADAGWKLTDISKAPQPNRADAHSAKPSVSPAAADGKAPAQPRERAEPDERAARSRPLAGLAAAGRLGGAAAQAALLRQSAALYQEAASAQREQAAGDTSSAAYTRYRQYAQDADGALDRAEAVDRAQGARAGAHQAGAALPAPGYPAARARAEGTTGQHAQSPADPAEDAKRAERPGHDGHGGSPAEEPGTGQDGSRYAPDQQRQLAPGAESEPLVDLKARERQAQEERERLAAQEDAAATSGPHAGRVAKRRTSAMTKDGKPLTLRFVVPDGPGSEQMRAVGNKIAEQLDRIGIRTTMQKVADNSYFQDHIASGDFDLAVYSWPGTAYPATDARPIYAKPQPGADGSLTVEQNYTRVGTDRIDQLFDQAASELDPDAERSLVKNADARIWAQAGSVPLFQRPELVATKKNLVNVGAFGFATPRYEDVGFRG
ncbi:ABC transporter substrate-binding protein [Streptomyces sp. NPDC059740]|uniref:ABC transporter substrate-binding protein n=1 Tax=Streptomyces sp. NPDC059740 TaxID=3346926 RepID=UPI0036695E9A